jgi:hypothetical protein
MLCQKFLTGQRRPPPPPPRLNPPDGMLGRLTLPPPLLRKPALLPPPPRKDGVDIAEGRLKLALREAEFWKPLARTLELRLENAEGLPTWLTEGR